MLLSDDQLRTILLGTGLIDAERLDETTNLAKGSKVPLAKLLVERDIISDEHLDQIIADAIKFPFVSLREVAIPEDVLKIIPEVVAKKQKIIAFKKDQQGLHLAMADPSNLEIREFVKKKVGLPVSAYLATERDIGDALSLYNKDVAKAFDEIIAESVEEAKAAKGGKVEPPIIKIVDTILSYAYQNKASDIHIEPLEEESLVRFRVDGILHDIVKLPVELHPQIVTRIKVLAQLRTDEHQAAQDGKFQFEVGG